MTCRWKLSELPKRHVHEIYPTVHIVSKTVVVLDGLRHAHYSSCRLFEVLKFCYSATYFGHKNLAVRMEVF